ncbi:hypothetical protein, partial [Serratia marcescens]|uniref:hypothetical protein n=1 Tax=Serratia marcescens TaxID=615 RepID=UPI002813DF33
DPKLSNEYSKLMQDRFEMSMMVELSFFLGLEVKQLDDEIFINQSKYTKELIKKFATRSVRLRPHP